MRRWRKIARKSSVTTEMRNARACKREGTVRKIGGGETPPNCHFKIWRQQPSWQGGAYQSALRGSNPTLNHFFFSVHPTRIQQERIRQEENGFYVSITRAERYCFFSEHGSGCNCAPNFLLLLLLHFSQGFGGCCYLPVSAGNENTVSRGAPSIAPRRGMK